MAYVGREFSAIDVGENEVFSFDFVKDVEAGETISSPEWTTSDAARLELIGPPSVFGTIVSQRMRALAQGPVTLSCFVSTSAGNRKHLFSRVSVAPGT